MPRFCFFLIVLLAAAGNLLPAAQELAYSQKTQQEPANAANTPQSIVPQRVSGSAGLVQETPATASLLFSSMPSDDPLYQNYLAAYASPGGKDWINAIGKRARPYAALIRERIFYYQLPEELYYLPFIESEFNPMAVSKSGAMGLWQFMKNSIGGYNIHINEWVDERRDIVKATDAALKKLKWNYEYYNDWLLALAAYNCGVGALDKAIKKAGVRDFWELKKSNALSRETAHYVPKLLALITVAGNARKFGNMPGWDELPRWTSIPLTHSVDITMLAEACGLSPQVLRQGNPELKYNVTPPDAAYALKVPEKDADKVREVLASSAGKLIKVYLHKVSSGDTISAISRYYEVSIDMIVRTNPGLRPDKIQIGQTIVIPALKDKKPYVNEKLAESPPDFSGSYTVKKGDTLWQIALAYNVSPELLAEKNGLSLTSVLREGMTLKVPIIKQAQP
mgnify:CR=1 FL=1